MIDARENGHALGGRRRRQRCIVSFGPKLLGFCIILLVAGNETTTNLMSNMLSIMTERLFLAAKIPWTNI